jgi:hypothetical protein
MTVTYVYDHMGIPVKTPKSGSKYSEKFKMHTTDGYNEHRIQWHCFEDGCPLHPLIQQLPHVAFRVNDLDKAVEGKSIILDPYYPFEGYKVAMVEIDGLPVEYVQTSLADEDIWDLSKHKNSVVHPE